ncbi:MAG: MFS transporter, partial [Chloroflexi bacterium]|nr:MFS transporter [Chloroflexota bacterium]
TLLLAFAPSLEFIYLAGFIVGFFGNMAGPAHQAMITDVLPEDKRMDGFGILRVIANLAVAIGPAIGGFLAARSYTLLFIIDVIASSITALIIFALVPETKPKAKPVVNQAPVKDESLGKTMAGYLKVFKDGIFLVYLGASMFMVLAYMQMNTTLPVFLRDIHGLPESGYGLLLSMNASMVVLFQFWITRRIKGFAPMKIMAWGMIIYAVGFSMYGFVSANWLFVLAMVIITIAEMLVSPTGQAIVAKLSPEDMRGRYMAVFGFTWTIPTGIGPLLAGVVMDNYDPNWVWYGAGIFLLISASIFAWLQINASSRFENLDNSETSAVEESAPA